MKSLSLNKPHVIIMVGIPGSGKTFFAEKFADTFHAPYVEYKKILTLAGSNSEAATTLTNYQIDELLKTHRSIIVEGDTDTRASRTELARKAKKAGYDALLIWVQTDPVTAKARATKISKDTTSPVLNSEGYDHKIKRFSPPASTEKPIVISGKHTYASQAKVVLQRLSAPRAEISSHTTTPTRLEQPSRRNITVR